MANKSISQGGTESSKRTLVYVDFSDLLRQPRVGCPQRVRAVSSLGSKVAAVVTCGVGEMNAEALA